ncbi:hypothetical protein GCM10010400_58150 [Streptomyces aculeolatus]|uniref:DNA cytosine methyltransferase n=1 Tax=Streptomyces aculeolatus TaxID=270689 RepID=UPI001CEC8FE5|nr:DNA cytosine methyltransferase [Streptomyces aculeolatus]
MTTAVFLFSGGCGDLRGATDAGYEPQYAANHDTAACDTARANWPGLWVQQCDINNLDMRSVPGADVVVGSPICWEVGRSGGRTTPRAQLALTFDDSQPERPDFTRTRMTAWDPIRYAEVHRPLAYIGENVPEFGMGRNRPLFDAWLHVWDALDYYPVIASVNAAHTDGPGYRRLPQLRHRVVWAMIRKDLGRLPDLRPRPDALCDVCGPVKGMQHWTIAPRARRVGEYGDQYHYVCPTPRCHRRVEPVVAGIGDVIDDSVRGHRFGDGWTRGTKRVPYVAATRACVAQGIARFGGEPFMVTRRNHGRATSLNEPIGTITAQGGNHHYLVRPGGDGSVDGCEYRPLTLAEKARLQGFPDHHVFAGEETAQRLQIGNAVPVNVATWAAERVRAVVAP